MRGSAVAAALVDAGFRADEILAVGRERGRTLAEGLGDLRQTKLAARELGGAALTVYRVGIDQLVLRLVQAGYTPDQVVEAVAGTRGATPEAIARQMVAAGIDAIDAAVAVARSMGPGTVTEVVAFLERVYRAADPAAAASAAIVAVYRAGQRLGYTASQVAKALVEGGIASREAVAEALVEMGLTAAEAAAVVWGGTTSTAAEALRWLSGRGMDAAALLQWAADVGIDAATALVALPVGMVADATSCVFLLATGVLDLSPVAGIQACVDRVARPKAEVVREAVEQGLVSAGDGLAWLLAQGETPPESDAPFWGSRLTVEQAAQLLVDAGRSLDDAVAWLLSAGYAAAEIVGTVPGAFQAVAKALARAMKAAGVPLSDITIFLVSLQGLTPDMVAEILASLGG